YVCALLLPLAATAQETAAGRAVGTVKSVGPNVVYVATDAGAEVSVLVPDGARVLELAAGQTNLSAATAITLQQVHVGDRVLVRGLPANGGKGFTASSVLVMKQSDVAQKRQHDAED